MVREVVVVVVVACVGEQDKDDDGMVRFDNDGSHNFAFEFPVTDDGE